MDYSEVEQFKLEPSSQLASTDCAEKMPAPQNGMGINVKSGYGANQREMRHHPVDELSYGIA